MKYNIIFPICILFTIISCNQANKKLVIESVKKDEPLVEKKKVNENFSKEEVLKQKITLKKSEPIPKKMMKRLHLSSEQRDYFKEEILKIYSKKKKLTKLF